jgi:hypothetical protein
MMENVWISEAEDSFLERKDEFSVKGMYQLSGK